MPRLHIYGLMFTGKSGLGTDQLDEPEGAEIRGNALWISDTSNGRILRYTLAGLPAAR